MKMFENRSFAFLALLLFIFICGTLSCDRGETSSPAFSGSNDETLSPSFGGLGDEGARPNQTQDGVAAFYKPGFPPDPGFEINGVYFQQITGGNPGESGTSTVVGPDDTVYIAAEKGTLLYLYIHSPISGQWSRRPLAYFALNPSLGIDSEGHLHVAYTDLYEYREKTQYSWNNKLAYATNKNGIWQHEMIDGEGDVGYDPCLVVDAEDNVHISYLDAGNKALKYATNRTGSWVTEIALPEGSDVGYGGESSLFIDDEGHAHISFTNDEGWYTGVYYATNKEGDWTYRTVGSGYRSALVVDQNGAVHIFFERDFGFSTMIVQLGYATNRSGIWLGWVLDSTHDSGYYPSASLREDGAIDIIYQNQAALASFIQYGVLNNGTFESQTHFGISSYREELSVANDSEGLFHIAYNVRYNLKTTTFDPQTSEFVTDEIEESYGITQTSHDIALDRAAQPKVCYKASFSNDTFYTNLFYAQKISGTWQGQPVDNEADSGYYCSISIDGNDAAHIAYVKIIPNSGYVSDDEKFLRYATNKTGQWEIQELDDSILKGQTSITLDSDENIHISYCDFEGKAILSNTTGQWIYNMIVEGGGKMSSIIVDESDQIHLSLGYNNGLTYAKYDGTWNFSSFETYPQYILSDSMVLDSSENVHIAYGADDLRSTDTTFNYLTNESGDWENILLGTTTVNEYINTKILIDSQDNLHVLCGSSRYGSIYYTNSSGSWESTPLIPGYVGGSEMDSDGYIHVAFRKEGALWYAKFPQGIEIE